MQYMHQKYNTQYTLNRYSRYKGNKGRARRGRKLDQQTVSKKKIESPQNVMRKKSYLVSIL